MMIAHFVQDLRRRFPTWDTPSKYALIIGLVLLPITLVLGFFGPEEIRLPAKIGAFGLLLMVQLVILWGNRGMMSPLSQAQKHFRDGDYETAREILENLPVNDQPSVDALTLLANTYRHLGLLEQSYQAVSQALELKPDYHYVLYGMGRTLLAWGQYADASNFITKALFSGAPTVVKFDLGHSLYRQNKINEAKQNFLEVIDIIKDEPYQLLLAQYCLVQMGEGQGPDMQLIQQGLPHWKATAEKFSNTPYGTAIQADVDILNSWLKET